MAEFFDKGAAFGAPAHLNDIQNFQGMVGLPNSTPADLDHLGKLSLRGKAIPGLIFTGKDPFLEKIDDYLKGPSHFYGLVIGGHPHSSPKVLMKGESLSLRLRYKDLFYLIVFQQDGLMGDPLSL
jgi:hypothetical protein